MFIQTTTLLKAKLKNNRLHSLVEGLSGQPHNESVVGVSLRTHRQIYSEKDQLGQKEIQNI